VQKTIFFLLVLQNSKTQQKLSKNIYNYLIFKYLFLF